MGFDRVRIAKEDSFNVNDMTEKGVKESLESLYIGDIPP